MPDPLELKCMVWDDVEPKSDALCQFIYFLFLEVSNISKLDISLSRSQMWMFLSVEDKVRCIWFE